MTTYKPLINFKSKKLKEIANAEIMEVEYPTHNKRNVGIYLGSGKVKFSTLQFVLPKHIAVKLAEQILAVVKEDGGAQ